MLADVLLAAVAARHGGRLATVDGAVAEALHPDDRHLVETIPAS
jgi:predicted nucleic acid-binding protein